MNMVTVDAKQILNNAAGNTQQGTVASNLLKNRVDIVTHDLHQIIEGKAPIGINGLQYLIQCQATLHMATAQNDPSKLRDLLKSNVSSIRGFVLSTSEGAPVAYAIYYPMIDKDGARVAYCEDFFIVESYRGKGVAKILFHELGKRTLNEDAEYLLWATDKRNVPVHDFVQNRLGAKQNGITTIDTSTLLKPEVSLKGAWDKVAFETRPINSNDVDLLQHHNYDPKIIRKTGDTWFKGMLTFNKSDSSLHAITPGWVHTSTFRMNRGLHLEQPTFVGTANAPEKSDELKANELAAYMGSIVSAAQKMNAKMKRDETFGHMRWHVDESGPVKDFLMSEYGFTVDSMLGTPESELIVYSLENGNLSKLAGAVPSYEIYIAPNTAIGFSPSRS